MRDWYIAVANPSCLTRAEGEVAQLGYRVFIPKLRKWISHARIKNAVYRPILGRYLFVEVDTDEPLKGVLASLQSAMAGAEWPRQSFGSLRNVNGIEGLVGIAGDPVPVPEGVVEGLIRRQLTGEWDFVTEGDLPDGNGGVRTNPGFPVGARVRLMEGEFAGLLATLTKHKRGRQIEIKFVGTPTTRTVYEMMVRPAA